MRASKAARAGSLPSSIAARVSRLSATPPRRSSDTKENNKMDLQLKGKTAVVTGGSEGIGKGIALALAKEGVDVAICARRKDVLEAAANEISKATGRKIVPIPADLRKNDDAKNFIEQAHKA